MKRLLMRLHLWLHDVQRLRGVRIGLTLVIGAAILLPGWQVTTTAVDLMRQRTAILEALRHASAARQDPAAIQLLEHQTVTTKDRTYGGANAIANPAMLFNAEGEMEEGTKEDLAWRLVLRQVPDWMPFALVQSPTVAVLVTCGALGALVLLVWLGLGATLLEWGVVVAIVAGTCWLLNMGMAFRTVLAVTMIMLMYAVLWRLVQWVLGVRGATLAVARTTALEGIRTHAAVGFAAPVAVLVPMLALSRMPHQGLYQAIPGFLDWAHTVVYASAAMLVLLFGCATTAFEIRDRQIWTVLTKPVSRLNWMLGKWLGATTLGCAVLAGGMCSIYVGAHYMAAQPPISEMDAAEVRHAILVGRAGVEPIIQKLSRERLIEIVEQEIDKDEMLRTDLESGRRSREVVAREIAVEKQREFMEQQRRIRPGDAADYAFPGLHRAAMDHRKLTLRYVLHAGVDDSHKLYPVLIQMLSGAAETEGAQPWVERYWVPGESYSYEIDPKFVGRDGILRVRLYNAGTTQDPDNPIMPGDFTMYFDPGDLEVMYAETTFAGNVVRAMLVDASKVAFLAALAVAAASLLSFPVAVLLSFGVFAMASLTPFLAMSLKDYYPDKSSGILIYGFQMGVKGVAAFVEFALSSFAQRAPSDYLAQGRVIGSGDLLSTMGMIGVLWTLVALTLGWIGSRSKEVAVYSGQS